MNGLLEQQKPGDKSRTYPFLQVIYHEFNAPGVPRDLGRPSTVSASIFWAMLKKALGPWEEVGLFFDSFSRAARWQTASRIQLVIFWALYLQNGHTMPKTFFATIKSARATCTCCTRSQVSDIRYYRNGRPNVNLLSGPTVQKHQRSPTCEGDGGGKEGHNFQGCA